tara:strand:- start:556 stop:1662 length:1107 start_codon:yes stop_codon:yes gene_type:complete
MASSEDLYGILGLEPGVDSGAIRKAYRRLARENHPDVNKESGAEAKFKRIQQAYDVLKDDKKRSLYDRYGHEGLRQGFEPGMAGFNVGGIGDIFDAFFGGGSGRRRRDEGSAGRDMQIVVSIEFLDAVHGVERDLDIIRQEICDACNGSGSGANTTVLSCGNCQGSGEVRHAQSSMFGQFVNVVTCEQCAGTGQTKQNPCSDCGGGGRVKRERKLAVTIPAGVDHNTELRLQGEGEAGWQGGAAGDLFVVIQVEAHPSLRREGINVFSIVEIDVFDAVLGGEVEVDTVDGPEIVKIPSGTQPNSFIKLANKGVPRIQRSGRGDHVLEVQVKLPVKLDEREKELFTELRDLFEADTNGVSKGFGKVFGK